MSRKLKEVVGRIDELVTEMETFKFVQGRQGQGRVVDRDRTHSFVIESETEGRGDDKENLVKLLTEVRPTENLTVLPVVGMGGLGKTTLAQLAYNDPRIKEHFELLVWVCVSEEFDVALLAKLIIDSIVQADCNVPPNNMELLQSRLRKEISGKRYLLVLDDVWNENVNKWEQLRALLNCGDLGSNVLVTTRSDRVATIMGTVESYKLGCLGEEDSWRVFQKRAFSKGVKENPELVEIGRKLVQNCGGLPLAIKTLGSLMSYKHEVGEWSAVLKQSTTWDNKHANDEVLPVLKLSYDHLPSYMKQCFAFCAVFPKDYVMEKEKLVQLWMAHGFIPSDGPGDLEMTGSNIFNELAWRSFFQDVEQVFRDTDTYSSRHGYCSRTTCKMHDLAQLMMRDECISLLESSPINNKPQCNVRHVSVSKRAKNINDVIECLPATRSLISFKGGYFDKPKSGFMKSNFLRVLSLSPQQYSFDNAIITSLGKMKHLRYLDLSNVYSPTLTEAITTFYLLQTLRLNNPSNLPEGMRYMVSLRHLYIEDCSQLKSMPPGLGELRCLQTLTCYIVGTSIGNNGIGELKTLNLSSQLEVYNLREVTNARDAREANMFSKQNLDHLALCWGMPKNKYSEMSFRSNGSEAVVVDHLEVLDALKPCNKLKVLRIREYRGDKFPVWMTEYEMLKNLVELHIIECTGCTNLPPVHRLPLLQILNIKFMDNLRLLCCEYAQITFPALKSLILEDMPNLDYWCEGDIGEKTSLMFPVLSDMSISDCPKLSAIPVTPLLEELKIKGNNTLSSLYSRGRRENNADATLSFKSWESLQKLEIIGFNHIIPPTNGRVGEELGVDVNAAALQELSINSSNFWFSPIRSNSPLWLWKCFKFLEVLKVQGCGNLIYWPEEELRNLIYLREMQVNLCRNFLGSLSEQLSEMSTRQVLLPKLKYLEFGDCPNMVEVPQLPKSLEKLRIDGSTKLEVLPEWLDSLVALKELEIHSCESLNSLPSSIKGLTALKVLNINKCHNMVEIPKLPRSLEILKIWYCKKLESLPEWSGSSVDLKYLQIDLCGSLNSIPSSIGCLISLERLYIFNCFNLASLPEGMQGLEALKDLKIGVCPKIRILPEGLLQRLRSLDRLCISVSPLLERDFQKHGKYWYLISEIPDVDIGKGRRSSKIGDLTRLISSCKIPCLSSQS